MRRGITPAAARRLALAVPGASEGSHHGVADFRVRGKIFATIHPGGEKGALMRLERDRIESLAESDPEAFAAAWGGRALLVTFARVSRAVYRDLLEDSARAITPIRASRGRRG